MFRLLHLKCSRLLCRTHRSFNQVSKRSFFIPHRGIIWSNMKDAQKIFDYYTRSTSDNSGKVIPDNFLVFFAWAADYKKSGYKLEVFTGA